MSRGRLDMMDDDDAYSRPVALNTTMTIKQCCSWSCQSVRVLCTDNVTDLLLMDIVYGSFVLAGSI